MVRMGRSAALAAALWTAALLPASTQEKKDTTKPAAPPKTTDNKPAPRKTTAPPMPDLPQKPADPNVVGIVNGTSITWDQLITKLKTDSKPVYQKTVADASGKLVAAKMYGDKPQTSVTISEQEVVDSLRGTPSPVLYGTLERMLFEEAVSQEAAKQGITATDAQLNDFIAQQLAGMRAAKAIEPGVTNDQFLAQYSQQRGITTSRLIQSQRPGLLLNSLLQKDLGKTFGHPIGPDDYVKAEHILVAVPQPAPAAKPEDVKKADAAALAKITKISDDIKSGKRTFEAAAKENSDDPGSKDKGGSLGVFTRTMMVKEFETAAFSLKPGEISKPVRSQFGYHLIKLQQAGASLTPKERQDVLNALLQDRRRSSVYSEELLKRTKKVNFLPMPPPQQPGPGMMPQQQGE